MNKPYRLTVKGKTGFRNVTGKPVIILDKRGIPFYDTRELDHIVWTFNLPEGEYFVREGNISKMVNPVEYDLLPLPKAERNKKGNPEHFDIYFADNPYKATVFWDKRAMLFDNALKEVPLPALVTIFQHECGHKYYATEEYCDRYAYNEMIKAGYNPSQIGFAFVKTLSDRQLPRKNALVNAMFANSKNINHYEYSEPEEDFVDSKPAGYYIGSSLVLKQSSPIGIWSNPYLTSKLLKTIYKGQNVGTIYSFVTGADGSLWWQLVDGGFVQHKEGRFDFGIADRTASGKEQADIVKKQNELAASDDALTNVFKGMDSVFDFFGKNLKWIIILIALLYLAPLASRAVKSFAK